MVRDRLRRKREYLSEGPEHLRIAAPAMQVRREAEGILLEVELGPADWIASGALTEGVVLAAGTPAIHEGMLIVEVRLAFGEFGAEDLDRVIDELAGDAETLRRRLAPDADQRRENFSHAAWAARPK
jgi:hypothetical protein